MAAPITVRGLTGTNAYRYVESIRTTQTKPPEARAKVEIQQASGIKRVHRLPGKRDNLNISGKLEPYRDFMVSVMDTNVNTVRLTNGAVLHAGEATGDVTKSAGFKSVKPSGHTLKRSRRSSKGISADPLLH